MKKKVIIIGGSKGIGRAINNIFKKDGAYLTHPMSSKTLDTSNIHSINKFLKIHKKTDILVLNTGGPPKSSNIKNISYDEWIKNFNQLFYGFYKILTNIKIAKNGYVFLISSHLIETQNTDMVISASLRTGFLHVFKALSVSMAKDKITFLNIAPGPIKTDRLLSLNNGNIEGLKNVVPAGYVSSQNELSKFIYSLVKYKIKYLTNKTIVFDGGISNRFL